MDDILRKRAKLNMRNVSKERSSRTNSYKILLKLQHSKQKLQVT